ncbi:MAG: FAD-binding oxidoreductase [Azospirillaceae bacterium]|nr:FAD-binding oxidoreductase [Azospirillaceae bacterium]
MTPDPNTWYGANRADDIDRPPLAGDIETETCVIGGGLAGIATALAIAGRGRPVVLLEARRIGWGASGRNGGFVSRGFPISMPKLAERYGLDLARALWCLSGEALTLVGRRAEAAPAKALDGRGALRCRFAGYPDTLRRFVDDMNGRFDAGLDYLPQDQLRTMLATSAYADGYLNPSSLQVNPLNLACAMARQSETLGAVLHDGSAATRIERVGAARRIHTAGGTVTARHVVLAGGAYLGLLNRRLGFATVPVASFVMTTEAASDRIGQAIRTGAAVSDTRVATDYYRRLPDGRLMWGGRASAFAYREARIAERLHADMARIYPQLADLKVATAWSGLMPIARHRMPVIGPIDDGLWVAACFGGLGLVTTTLAGELIGAAITEGDDRYRYFARFGLPFAGGSLGRAAFQLIYWRHKLADRFASAPQRADARRSETS